MPVLLFGFRVIRGIRVIRVLGTEAVMRLFVAVEIDEPARLAAAEAVERLRAELSRRGARLDVRWVPADKLHISYFTVRAHCRHILEKTECRSIKDLRQKSLIEGWT